MEANNSVSLNDIRVVLDIFNNYLSKHSSFDNDTKAPSAINLNEWNSSIVNATPKDLTKLFEGIKSVNIVLKNHFKANETSETNSLASSNSNVHPLSIFLLLVDGYAVSILAAIGVVLNILGICFLSTGSRRKKVYSLFLSTLFFFDALFLCLEFLKGIDRHFLSVPTKYVKTYHTLLNSGIRFSMIASIFSLVAIARIRLSAIRKPFLHNSSLLSGKERRIYWFQYFFPIVLLSIALTLPLLLGVENMAHTNENADPMTTSSSPRLTQIISTLYVGVLNLGLVGMMPMICLVYLAYQIRIELKKRNKRFAMLRAHQAGQGIVIKDKSTRTLLIIIIAFIALHSFRMIWICGEIYLLLNPNNKNDGIDQGHLPIWCYVIASLSELFMAINSTVNVIIYVHSNEDKMLKNCLGK